MTSRREPLPINLPIPDPAPWDPEAPRPAWSVPVPMKECAACGQSFRPVRPYQRWCSRACGERAAYKRRKGI